jgi:hypothetical protein
MPSTEKRNSYSHGNRLSILEVLLYLIAASAITMMSASFLLWLRF